MIHKHTKNFFLILSGFVIGFVVFSALQISDSRGYLDDHQQKQASFLLSKVHRARASAESVTIPILMYHHVGDVPLNSDPVRRDLTVSTESFKEQAEWLKNEGYKSVTLRELYRFSQGMFDLPAKPIVFTFDDGYTDAFENAVPVLVQNGYTGSFAIITQFPGTTSGSNVYASWEQIIAARKKGMEIVSHTQNHFDGTSSKYSREFIYKNLLDAKKDLLDHGINTNILIYPYGHYNASYIDLAKKAGYDLGLTVRFGEKFNPADPMEVPRVRVHAGEDLQRFEDILLGRLKIERRKTPAD